MAYTVEKLLSDAATLVNRLKENDTVADILISQTDNLQKRMEAMKEVIVPFTLKISKLVLIILLITIYIYSLVGQYIFLSLTRHNI